MANKKKPNVRQFIVDAEMLDGDGAGIRAEQFGSGGAWRADGTLINQYKNPRPYDADTADGDRAFATWLNRERVARTQREEAELQAAYDRRVQQTADGILWVLREVAAPIAQANWDALAKRICSDSAGGWTVGYVEARARRPRSRVQLRKLRSPVGADEASITTINTPVGVINLEDYRGCRVAATESVLDGEDATTA